MSKDNYIRRALTILEVDPAAVAQAPKVQHLFKSVRGGITRVWEALEASDEPEARKLVEARAKLKKTEAQYCPFEALAIAAGLTTKRAFGVVSEAMVEYSQDASKLMLHAAAPDMMAKAVKRATDENSAADGKLLLQAVGLVPRPKNTVNIHNGDIIKGHKQIAVVLPNPEDTGRRLGNRFNMEMTVPEIAAPEFIEPDYEEDEVDSVE